MKILAIEKEVAGVAAGEFQPHLKDEALRVYELYQTGVLREVYFRQDRPEAIIILECVDVDEANKILGSLPLVKAGLITFDVIPLRPYPGFSRLFPT